MRLRTKITQVKEPGVCSNCRQAVPAGSEAVLAHVVSDPVLLPDGVVRALQSFHVQHLTCWPTTTGALPEASPC